MSTTAVTPTLDFKTLALPDPVRRALEAMQFTAPTPIQAQAIPLVMEGRDLIGCAQTGTGKTAAFTIPLVTKMLANPRARSRALVLVPTRELAEQVARAIREITQFSPELVTTVLIGGVAMFPQTRSLKKIPQIIVATPGRLVDHLQQGNLNLDDVRFLVLDEADRMLDMGFAPQIDRVLHFVPQERQSLLFSATLPPEILKVAARYLKNPSRVSIGAVSRPIEKIVQKLVRVDAVAKNTALLSELAAREGSVIIFARTKSRTDKVAKFLEKSGISSTLIHGGRSQGQRQRALEGFRDERYRCLVATDIAARGLDIPHVAHVINYDLPDVPEDYVHRIGRTGRAGATGEAVSLVAPDESPQWNDIQRLINPGSAPAMGGGQSRRPQGHGWSKRGAPMNFGGASRDGATRSGATRGDGPRGAGRPQGRPQGMRPMSKDRVYGEANGAPAGVPSGGRPGVGPRLETPKRFFDRRPQQTGFARPSGRPSGGPTRPEGGFRPGNDPRRERTPAVTPSANERFPRPSGAKKFFSR